VFVLRPTGGLRVMVGFGPAKFWRDG
jgi:hypothetical protein